MDIYSIYKVTNNVNDKVYIGFTNNLKRRIKRHKICSKTSDSKFYRSIRKYGWEMFSWEIIYQSLDLDHTKNVMERYFIEHFDSFTNGYNSTHGGDGVSGVSRIQPQTEKQLRSDRMKGNTLGKNLKGIPLSESHKQSLRKPKTVKQIKTDAHKKNIGLANAGKKREIVTCPHCGKTGGKPAMFRFHFSNCPVS